MPMHYSYLEFAEGKYANRCRSIKDLADIFELEATTAVLRSSLLTWSMM